MRSTLHAYKWNRSSYCWFIVFAGALGLFASLGLGRFSLGMMLPGMGEGLGLSYSQMGLISTMNFCGYLGAVLLCSRFSKILGARLLIFLALLLVGSSMFLVGYSSSLVIIILLYCLTGAGSALSNIPIMSLIPAWFTPERRGRAAGLCVMGNGIGILLSGHLVPSLNDAGGGWRLSWLVLGGLVITIAFVCLALIRNEPPSESDSGNEKQQENTQQPALIRAEYRKQLLHIAVLYFLFGITYVIYITFLVTSLVQERGLSEQSAGEMWSLVGLLSIGSGPIFGYISDKIGRKFGLMLVFSIQTAAYLLVAVKLPIVSVYLSIILYGLVAFSVPTIIAALVGDYAGPGGMAAAFGFVTFIFGIGQIAGPAVAGMLAEKSGSFSMSFVMAAVLTFTAVILCTRLPDKTR